MSKLLTLDDLREMLNTSESIAQEMGKQDIFVQIVDEDGNIFNIEDVKFDIRAGSITLTFDHDE